MISGYVFRTVSVLMDAPIEGGLSMDLSRVGVERNCTRGVSRIGRGWPPVSFWVTGHHRSAKVDSGSQEFMTLANGGSDTTH